MQVPRLWLLSLLGLLAGGLVSGYVERGFLLVAPKVLSAGAQERVCVTLFQLQGAVNINLYLLPEKNSTISQALASSSSSVNADTSGEQTHCFFIDIPRSLTKTGVFLRAVVSTVGFPGFNSQKTSPVRVLPFELVTLVQTDKAKYKAGQKVQFRVVTLKSDLTAIDETIEQVYITTPSNTRLAQFDNVPTQHGIAQLEFQLTDEPPLGTWTIHVRRSQGRIERQRFEVDEFVLPRFEVTLDVPKFIIRRANTLTVKVCAKYTFGQPLVGGAVSVRVASSLSHYRLDREIARGASGIRRDARQNITLTETTEADGCVTLDVLLSKIGLGSGSRLYAYRISISANVTESGTELTESTSSSVPIQDRRYSVTIDRLDSSFIKPGLEYVGYATLKDQNGVPVSGDRLEICYNLVAAKEPSGISSSSTSGGGAQLSSAQYRQLPIIVPVPVPIPTQNSRICREYDTNAAGRVRYTIPAQDAGIRNVNINARRIESPSSRSSASSTRRFIGSSNGYKNLRVWFSPSGSYITIYPESDPSQLKCDGPPLVLVLRSRVVNGIAIYLLMARGKIVEKGNLVFNSQLSQLSIPLRFELTPQFKLLVYHVNRLGEVVADARTFKVENCFQSEVTVSWSQSRAEPRQQVDFTVQAATGALCGVTAVDKSVRLLGSSNELTATSIFNRLERYIIRPFSSPRLVQGPHEYCRRKPIIAESSPQLVQSPATFGRFVLPQQVDAPREARSFGFGARQVRGFIREPQLEAVRQRPDEPVIGIRLPPPEPIIAEPESNEFYYVVEEDDSIKAFDEAGYLPVTNLVLETRRCQRRNRTRPIYHHYGFPQVASGGGFSVRAAGGADGVNFALASASIPEARSVAVADDALAGTAQPPNAVGIDVAESAPAPASQQQEITIRSLFPETFLFDLVSPGADGAGPSNEAVIRRSVPDTITSWIGSAFCSHPSHGFGLSNTSSITVFRPFFIQLQLPYSIKRGEELRLPVSIFNYHSQSLSVLVDVQQSPDYQVVSSAVQTVCVPVSRAAVTNFRLSFTTLDSVNVTVTARTGGTACPTTATLQAQDAVRRSLVVKPEGFPQEDVQSAFLCRDGNSGPTVTREVFSIQQKPTLVVDSERVWLTAVGDLLAASLSNLEHLVRVPTGCGEQNMLGFVPNIVVRKYLEAVDLLTDNIRTRTTNNMRTGYQRQLRYRGKDGSYAAFQPREGSLWLTAYVVRSYAAAAPYITIDSADLDVSRQWLISKQASDGSFPRVGKLFHREMRGGVEFGGQEALTAYVVLALLESGGEQAAIDKATAYISGSTSLGTLYAEILVAHALLMADHSDGANRVTALLSRGTRRGGELYWEGSRSGRYGGSRSTDVEMTSYMVLSLLKLGGPSHLADAALAIKWINRQRNGRGGFVSTQDTVVALTAMAEFARRTYNPSVAVQVEAQLGTFEQQWTINAGSRLLTRQVKAEPLQLPGDVVFTVRGSGCALVQAIYRYNTRTAFPDPSFRLLVSLSKSSCDGITLRICTNLIERNAESNMAIVEIEMLSGWVSVDSSLRRLKKDGVIERWEFNEGRLVLYFDGFSTKEVCFSVRMLRDVVVDKLKPAVVRVYDYYATEDRFEVEYGPPECNE